MHAACDTEIVKEFFSEKHCWKGSICFRDPEVDFSRKIMNITKKCALIDNWSEPLNEAAERNTAYCKRGVRGHRGDNR